MSVSNSIWHQHEGSKQNVEKCKILSICMKNVVDYTYMLGDANNKATLTKVTSMKDLGVIFDSSTSTIK